MIRNAKNDGTSYATYSNSNVFLIDNSKKYDFGIGLVASNEPSSTFYWSGRLTYDNNKINIKYLNSTSLNGNIDIRILTIS